DAVEGARIPVEERSSLEEDVADPGVVIVVERLLPVDVEVGCLREDDDRPGLGGDPELPAQRLLGGDRGVGRGLARRAARGERAEGDGRGDERWAHRYRSAHLNLEWHSLHVAFISLSAVPAAAASLAVAAVPSALAFSLSLIASASNSGPLEKSLIF